jgi:hypothetical protein
MFLGRLVFPKLAALWMSTDWDQIWQIADTENRGLLTPSGFGVVLRLIGHAQAGRPPSAELATQGNTPAQARPISHNLTYCAQLALCHDSMDNQYRRSPPKPLGHLQARHKQGLLQFGSLLSPPKRLTSTHCCLRSQGQRTDYSLALLRNRYLKKLDYQTRCWVEYGICLTPKLVEHLIRQNLSLQCIY